MPYHAYRWITNWNTEWVPLNIICHSLSSSGNNRNKESKGIITYCIIKKLNLCCQKLVSGELHFYFGLCMPKCSYWATLTSQKRWFMQYHSKLTNSMVNSVWAIKHIWPILKIYINGNTGLDRKSAHPLLFNTRKQGHCSAISPGGTSNQPWYLGQPSTLKLYKINIPHSGTSHIYGGQIPYQIQYLPFRFPLISMLYWWLHRFNFISVMLCSHQR